MGAPASSLPSSAPAASPATMRAPPRMWRSSARPWPRPRVLLAPWVDPGRQVVALASPWRGSAPGLCGVMNCSSQPVGPTPGPPGKDRGGDATGPPRPKRAMAPGPASVGLSFPVSTGTVSAALPPLPSQVAAPAYTGSHAGTRTLRVRDTGTPVAPLQEVPKEGALWTGPDERDDVTGGVGPEVRDDVTGRMLLVDGSALLYRAYHKVMARITRHATEAQREAAPDNEDVIGTVFKFLGLLLPLFQLLGPTHAAVALDVSGPTFRDELYPGYKAGRAPTPDAVRNAKPYAESALQALGLVVFKEPDVEADDVLASAAQQALDEGMAVRVASPDKDFFQLLGPRLKLLRHDPARSKSFRSTQHRASRSEFVEFTEADFRGRFPNLAPPQHVDILALMGDASDSIPGVRGIGEKSAKKLVEQYGSVDAILADAANIESKRCREAILKDNGQVRLWRDLVTLRKDLDLGVPMESLRLARPRDGGALFWQLTEGLGHSPVVMPEKLRAEVLQFWDSLPPSVGRPR